MQETFSRLIRSHRQQTERREMIDAWNSSIERIRERFAKTIEPKSSKSDAEEKERTDKHRGWKCDSLYNDRIKGRRSGREGSKDQSQLNCYDIIRGDSNTGTALARGGDAGGDGTKKRKRRMVQGRRG